MKIKIVGVMFPYFPYFSCVPSSKCKEVSENVDLRGENSGVDLRQDYENSLESCVIPDAEQDGSYIEIGQRQSGDYTYDSGDNFVCCQEENVELYEECPDNPGYMYV